MTIIIKFIFSFFLRENFIFLFIFNFFLGVQGKQETKPNDLLNHFDRASLVGGCSEPNGGHSSIQTSECFEVRACVANM